MHTCRRCGTPNRPGRKHCIACGEPLSELLDEDARTQGLTLPGPGVPASEAESRSENEPRSELPDEPPSDAARPRGLPQSLRGRTLLGIAPGASAAPNAAAPNAVAPNAAPPPAATDHVASAHSEQLEPATGNQDAATATLSGVAPSGTSPNAAPDASAPSASAPDASAPSAAPPGAAPTSAPSPPSEPLDQDTLQSREAAPSPPESATDAPKPLAPTEQFKAHPAATEQFQAHPGATEAHPAATEQFEARHVATEQFEARHVAPQAVGARSPEPPASPGAAGRDVDPTLPPDSTPPARDTGSKSRTRRAALIVAGALLLAAGAAGAFLLWRAKAGGKEPATAAFRANVTLESTTDGPVAVLGIVAPAGAQVRLNGELLETSTDAASSDAVRIRHALDLSEQTAGGADDVELTDTTLAIEVTAPSGATSRAELPVRLPVTPLALTSPGPRWVLDRGTLLVIGSAAPGARIRSGAHLARADEEGRFVLPILAPKLGVLTVTATGRDQLPRATQVHVVEAATLPPPTPFSALPERLTARVRVDGEVKEARQGPNGVTLLIEVSHGCAVAPCHIEVLHPMRLAPARLRGARSDEGPSYGPGQDLTVVGDVLAADARPRLRAEALESR